MRYVRDPHALYFVQNESPNFHDDFYNILADLFCVTIVRKILRPSHMTVTEIKYDPKRKTINNPVYILESGAMSNYFLKALQIDGNNL